MQQLGLIVKLLSIALELLLSIRERKNKLTKIKVVQDLNFDVLPGLKSQHKSKSIWKTLHYLVLLMLITGK